MGDAGTDDQGPLASVLIMLRLLVAWCIAALGALGLLMGFADTHYVIFHAVLLVAGLAMLGFRPMFRRPRPIAYLTGAAVAVLGLVISALPRASAVVCCRLAGYDHPHGFPFAFLAGGHLDPWRALADLVFWACAGLLPLVVIALVAPRAEPAPDHPAGHTAHAEQRAEVADDESVGGLP
ncbi:MAG TPA: hypothetical protein VFW27_10655 [Actinoplanes sp.]|jgi:hypothetical protein|nr:hypothetical protein [Actinoplanes sp.]